MGERRGNGEKAKDDLRRCMPETHHSRKHFLYIFLIDWTMSINLCTVPVKSLDTPFHAMFFPYFYNFLWQ